MKRRIWLWIGVLFVGVLVGLAIVVMKGRRPPEAEYAFLRGLSLSHDRIKPNWASHELERERVYTATAEFEPFTKSAEPELSKRGWTKKLSDKDRLVYYRYKTPDNRFQVSMMAFGRGRAVMDAAGSVSVDITKKGYVTIVFYEGPTSKTALERFVERVFPWL